MLKFVNRVTGKGYLQSEEHVFKLVQGYTYDEIIELVYEQFYQQDNILSIEFYMLATGSTADWMLDRNKLLKTYGWTHDMLSAEWRQRTHV